MKNKFKLLLFLCAIFFTAINVKAYSSDDYKYRNLCDNFEVAGFHSDGAIVQVECFNTFQEAENYMKTNGANDLAIMTKVDGLTKIIDANVGLLDLSVSPQALTYFYRNSNMNTFRYTYMDTGSLYGGVDGAILETVFSSKGVWAAKVLTGGHTGWISQENYEVVPITWIKSTSTYTVTNESIRHNYVAKIQNYYSGSKGSTIGPKPEMLNPGTYYSFDGHYFYTNLETMIKDYRNNNRNNSVNKDRPYYNYYMSLSNHTRTSYSSINIDEYIRNNMGITQDAYGNDTNGSSSRLYGKGTFFYYAQEKYGVNAILSLSLSRNETAHGRSNLAINKNNGFGLNAVDSSPTESAYWYASFASSILGYASKYVTYGYNHPRDWRYFGPQFGDKMNGMNVNYASDTYWSEKMAANYYSLDKAKGMQDYNFYQLGVTKEAANTFSDSTTASKYVYTYPEAGDALVIIGEKIGESIGGNNLWYKVVSDLNIDSNFNEISSGNYNWNSYVYVPAYYITKINNGKNGYISPNDVTEYINKDYEYDLYVENTTLKPKVAKSIKNTSYYYDSSLQDRKNKTLLKDRYVMVYTAAYDSNNQPVAYLVTSDYKYDQKDWVSADSIDFVSSDYGHFSVTAPNNVYTWVNLVPEDTKATLISGQYTNSYTPVLEQKQIGSNLWYRIPIDLSGTTNEFGWTLAEAPDVKVTLLHYETDNQAPKINATDKTIYEGDSFNPLEGVTATDKEDGDITNKIVVETNNVNINTIGEYSITYKVTDNNNKTTRKTIKVTVQEKKKTMIIATDKVAYLDEEFNPLEGVSAIDLNGNDITKDITIIENTVNMTATGEYKIVYQVIDSTNTKITKEIKVTVKERILQEKNGEFYLDSLKFDKTKKQYQISGYLIILGVDNTSKANYYLIAKNKNTDEEYQLNISRWTENVPYDLGKEGNNSYSNSWFKGYISLEKLPEGDYDLYVKAIKGDYTTTQQVTNLFNKTIDKRANDDKQGYNFKVLLSLKSKKVELNIRKQLITTKTSNTFRNMVNNYDNMEFSNNKLHVIGTSYNYDGTYAKQEQIERKLVLENIDTYKRYTFDIGSTNKGSYNVTSTDNKDKSFAWYDNEVDISSLEKGTYSIIVYTKTIDSEDYGEVVDIFGSINPAKATINDKEYEVTLNKSRQNRIELIVK